MSDTGLSETCLRATGIGLMVWTTLVFSTRTIFRHERTCHIGWHEAWLCLGYVFFMIISSVYVGNSGLLFRLLAVQEGLSPPYEGLIEDGFSVQKMFFFTSPGLWLTLWSVKFSLLAFHKKMIINVPLYIRLWWAIVAYCIITLILSVTLHLTACRSLKASFTAGACGRSPRDVRGSLISFWEAFAADLSSDILIMLLPLGLIRNLQIPLSRKVQIGALVGLGIMVMISSIIRVVQVGATTASSNSQPSLTWLALWSMIESSVAIMVGCGPGLYRKAKSIYGSQDAVYYNSRGYIKTRGSHDRQESQIHEQHVDDMFMAALRSTNMSRISGGGSEEGAIASNDGGQIRVTTSVTISRILDDNRSASPQPPPRTSTDSFWSVKIVATKSGE